VEVAGVVLPLELPDRFRGGGGAHAHTGGLALGFPDLAEHFHRHPGFARHWPALEHAISAAALRVMGWGSGPRPGRAARSSPPPNALRLLLSGTFPGADGEEGFDPDAHPLSGTLQKVFPITDVSGRNARMQSVGSPAAFRAGGSSVSFSRDPRRL
jgi:hypothetical protein